MKSIEEILEGKVGIIPQDDIYPIIREIQFETGYCLQKDLIYKKYRTAKGIKEYYNIVKSGKEEHYGYVTDLCELGSMVLLGHYEKGLRFRIDVGGGLGMIFKCTSRVVGKTGAKYTRVKVDE